MSVVSTLFYPALLNSNVRDTNTNHIIDIRSSPYTTWYFFNTSWICPLPWIPAKSTSLMSTFFFLSFETHPKCSLQYALYFYSTQNTITQACICIFYRIHTLCHPNRINCPFFLHCRHLVQAPHILRGWVSI